MAGLDPAIPIRMAPPCVPKRDCGVKPGNDEAARSIMARMLSRIGAIGIVLLALTAPLAAQEYPTKPGRLLVPFPPGAINDAVGRMIAAQLSERLGKQVIVENRSGAG